MVWQSEVQQPHPGRDQINGTCHLELHKGKWEASDALTMGGCWKTQMEASNVKEAQCEGPQVQHPLSPCTQTLCALPGAQTCCLYATRCSGIGTCYGSSQEMWLRDTAALIQTRSFFFCGFSHQLIWSHFGIFSGFSAHRAKGGKKKTFLLHIRRHIDKAPHSTIRFLKLEFSCCCSLASGW